MAGGLFFGLSACQDPLKIGADLLPAGSQAGVFFSDTFTVKASTVLLDSVRTSGAGVGLLAGRYNDPVFGLVEARSYFQVAPFTSDSLKLDTKAAYDSLVLTLQYNGYYYGDTNRYQSLSVHRLNDTLGNAKVYLNTSRVSYQNTPLGQLRYKPFRGGFSTVSVRLSDALGRELWALAGKPEGTNSPAFRNFVKGLAQIPGTTDEGAVVSFSNVALSVHYHADTVKKRYEAFLGGAQTPTARFSQITALRVGGDPLAALKPGQALPAARTNGKVYFQDGVGLGVKLEFPSLFLLRDLPQGKVAFNKAELIIEPVPESSSTGLSVPSALMLVETNEANQVLKTQGSIRYVLQEGSNSNPQLIGYFNENYLFNVTTQLQQMLTGQRGARSLILHQSPPAISISGTQQYILNGSYGIQVSRLVLDARRIKLRVYYTISNN
ncbi:MAG: DUF4270 domain-containing protein [Cytophagaceae bacterium]|nr:DUF4270 domain-containing protein [Cytophagaceae bacterium]